MWGERTRSTGCGAITPSWRDLRVLHLSAERAVGEQARAQAWELLDRASERAGRRARGGYRVATAARGVVDELRLSGGVVWHEWIRGQRELVDDPTARNSVVHIVSSRWWLADRLGLAIPRSLCGEDLSAEGLVPGEDTAPVCGQCVRLNGGTPVEGGAS